MLYQASATGRDWGREGLDNDVRRCARSRDWGIAPTGVGGDDLGVRRGRVVEGQDWLGEDARQVEAREHGSVGADDDGLRAVAPDDEPTDQDVSAGADEDASRDVDEAVCGRRVVGIVDLCEGDAGVRRGRHDLGRVGPRG